MLKRASINDLKTDKLHRVPGQNYVVVSMRVYPRFIPKIKIDEFLSSLSPKPRLFAEYRNLHTQHNSHEIAFELVNYEERFDLNEEGMEHLTRLAALALTCDVHLTCICKADQHCHVDLILLMAEHLIAAPVPSLPHEYPRFRARLNDGQIRRR